jgi:phosphoglycerol geranylgeranyltransferase
MGATLTSFFERQGKHQGSYFCWLVDPDKYDQVTLENQLKYIQEHGGIDGIFVGGSLMMADQLDQCLATLKAHTTLPVILFPGSSHQINDRADALLLLSLISGRNPDLLIGRHVEMAPTLKQSQMTMLATGYMLVDTGCTTTAAYMSNTQPIPYNKTDIAISTAMAGEMLGLQHIYLDGGSGATSPLSSEMIAGVRNHISVPLIVGGGIRTPDEVRKASKAGADVVVVGNAIEENPDLLPEIAAEQTISRTNGH